MKRGLIVWDVSEVPPPVLDERLERAREVLRAHELPALVVYTDVWRSNHARSLVCFMPFWGRSLLVVPLDARPVLLCGHSPRVYPWLRTVTFVDELRPTKDFAVRLVELASERGWRRMGVVDRGKLPHDIERGVAGAGVELVDVAPWEGLVRPDATELAMRRTALGKTRALVDEQITEGGEHTERGLVAGLERALRRGGMEDVWIRLSQGPSAPRPPAARAIDETTSVFIACEYRGHWVQIARPLHAIPEARQQFLQALEDLTAGTTKRFDLGGALPYRAVSPQEPLEPGRLIAVHLECSTGTYFGDTCMVATPTSAELL